MQTIHIKNLEKYHPGYKDRELIWCKTYFKMINADPEFEMLCEIDRWRFVAFVMLELQVKKPIPINPEYLKRKGFDLRKRPISLTIKMLHNLADVCNSGVTKKNRNVTQSRVEKSRVEKSRYSRFEVFWSAYPKKVGKGKAEESFLKINPSESLYTKILTAIGEQGKSDQWKKDNGQFIPNPATWLNQKRWDDELPHQETTAEQMARIERERNG